MTRLCNAPSAFFRRQHFQTRRPPACQYRFDEFGRQLLVAHLLGEPMVVVLDRNELHLKFALRGSFQDGVPHIRASVVLGPPKPPRLTRATPLNASPASTSSSRPSTAQTLPSACSSKPSTPPASSSTGNEVSWCYGLKPEESRIVEVSGE